MDGSTALVLNMSSKKNKMVTFWGTVRHNPSIWIACQEVCSIRLKLRKHWFSSFLKCLLRWSHVTCNYSFLVTCLIKTKIHKWQPTHSSVTTIGKGTLRILPSKFYNSLKGVLDKVIIYITLSEIRKVQTPFTTYMYAYIK